MFAIDGVKLPSNADKRRSGTRAEFAQEAEAGGGGDEDAAAAPRASDERVEPDLDDAARPARIERLQREAKRIRDWLAAAPEIAAVREGRDPQEQRTDNEQRQDGHLQGRDPGLHRRSRRWMAKHQIIVEAQAHGTGSEQELLLPVVRRCSSCSPQRP